MKVETNIIASITASPMGC